MTNTVQAIKERLDIADVVRQYVTLQEAGTSLKGRCPFHTEKSPSFFVSPERGTYYCFGCGAKGDAFSFIQEMEGVSFREALVMLAERAGVPLERMDPAAEDRTERVYAALAAAAAWYADNLERDPTAQEYLTGRGIGPEAAKRWGLGIAPSEWRALRAHLRSAGWSDDVLKDAGLVRNPDAGKEPYDVFRDRVMFPIRNASGKVIAFTGRSRGTDPDAPKYLNSPETAVFKKSETLFGIDMAKHGIRTKGYALLVEGQMDCLMAHEHGFDNAIATSGTAFAEGHAERLARMTTKMLIAYDGDDAGVAAARRAAELALDKGFDVKIARLPGGLDPADMLKESREGFAEVLKNSLTADLFVLETAISKAANDQARVRAVRDSVLPLVRRMRSSMEQSRSVAAIARRTGIREEAIWADLRTAPEPQRPEASRPTSESEKVLRKDAAGMRIAAIAALLEKAGNAAAAGVRDRLAAIAGDGLAAIEERLHERSDEILFEIEERFTVDRMLPEAEDLLVTFEEDVLRARFVDAMRELQEAEARGSPGRDDLLAECQRIGERLRVLSETRARHS